MSCDDIRERLLAHLYGALTDGEAGEVMAHVRECEGCREALAGAEVQKDVLAEAARGSAEGMEFEPPAPRKGIFTGPRMAAAATILIAVAGLLLYRAALRGPVLADHPRWVVTGPASFPAGETVEFEVRKETIEGDPLPIDGEVRLASTTSAVVFDARTVDTRGGQVVRFPGGTVPAGYGAWLQMDGVQNLHTYATHPEGLAYLATDKPLYRPGEPLRVRGVVLDRYRLTPTADRGVTFVLRSPRGDEVARSVERTVAGVASAEFGLAPGMAGGEYTISLEADRGTVVGGERTVMVRTYRVPRLKTDLELDRESYGPGEEGAAWLSVERAEGGVPEGATVRADLEVDGEKLSLGTFDVPESGAVTVPFAIPAEVAEGRAVLTAVVSDGGNVEGVAKSVPISLGRLDVEILPEGGELVAGLPGRIYFRVRSPAGEPADLVADVVTSSGAVVGEARTEVLGMGRFPLTPRTGETYRLVPRRPGDVSLTGAEFRPAAEGVSLVASADGFLVRERLSVEVGSTFDGDHEVLAYCRGQLLARRTVRLAAGEPETVTLDPAADVGGVVRVTVLDPEGRPRAERLVARVPARRLTVALTPEPADVSPGGEVKFLVTTRDEAGNPAQAAVGVSVVDDAVLALADDEDTAPMPLHFLLGLEVDELENAALFADGGRATDLLLGTQGWRRFAWNAPGQFLAANEKAGRRVVSAPAEAEVVRIDTLDEARAAAAGRLKAADRQVKRVAGALLAILGFGAAFALIARIRPVRVPALAGALAVAVLGFVLVSVAVEPRAPTSDVSAMTGTAPPVGAMPGGAVVMDALLPAGAEVDPGEPRFAQKGDAALALEGGGPAAGVFFNDGADGDFRARAENLFDEALGHRVVGGFRRPDHVFAYSRAGTGGGRTDFTEVLYWNPLLLTDKEGRAEFSFQTSDSITTFRAVAEAHGPTGRLGRAEAEVRNRIPFYVEPKLPVELSARDRLTLPVAVANATNEDMDVTLALSGNGAMLRLPGAADRVVRVPADGRARALYSLIAGEGRGEVALTLTGEAPGGLADRVTRNVAIVPRGYPMEVARGGTLADERTTLRVLLPPEMNPDSLTGGLTVYPSALATLLEGLESMLRQPGGCFEQASSSNYPNTLILSYLSDTGTAAPEVARRARSLLADGYRMLTGYECGKKGYEWFGADPANPALTAYGLLEFTDMARVHEVDREMIDRTRDWLLAGRSGDGSFRFESTRALDTFGGAPADVTQAYVIWAITEADPDQELESELRALAEAGRQSDDPYLVALAALALRNSGGATASALAARLAGMQAEDGSLTGKSTSITSSRGDNLTVETTALAAIAFLRDPARRGEAEKAISFLLEKRRGGGRFGATQATILALKALIEHARQSAEATGEMDFRVFVNGHVTGHGHIHEGMREALVFRDEILPHLVPGENLIEIDRIGEGAPPFSLSVSYHTSVPPADAACAVRLATTLERTELREGDSVGLTVRIENREDAGIPMTLARVGLPAGLTPRTERLTELVDAGEIAFFELRPREVTVYLRGMAAGEEREIRLDLTAEVPGEFEGPASSAYLYYTDDVKWWVPPMKVRIDASR